MHHTLFVPTKCSYFVEFVTFLNNLKHSLKFKSKTLKRENIECVYTLKISPRKSQEIPQHLTSIFALKFFFTLREVHAVLPC